jgi:predicted DCC family thiol-disulfide oxidoreductase YuxK
MTFEAADMPSPGHTLVLYDGVCGLCNRLVRFLLRRDTRDEFRFAPLQSEFGQTLLRRLGLNAADLDSVVVITDLDGSSEQAFTKSTAILASLDRLGGIWKAALVVRILPIRLREALYDYVAHRRYRIFGKHEECPMPNPSDRHKFLPAE